MGFQPYIEKQKSGRSRVHSFKKLANPWRRDRGPCKALSTPFLWSCPKKLRWSPKGKTLLWLLLQTGANIAGGNNPTCHRGNPYATASVSARRPCGRALPRQNFRPASAARSAMRVAAAYTYGQAGRGSLKCCLPRAGRGYASGICPAGVFLWGGTPFLFRKEMGYLFASFLKLLARLFKAESA